MPNSQVLKELVTKADVAALNSAIADQHIAPENIVSVILLPAQSMAIGDYEAKYRVIYRV